MPSETATALTQVITPAIGVVANGELSRNSLRHLVQDAGFSLGFCGHADELPNSLVGFEQHIKVWLIDAVDDEDLLALDKLADAVAPILINDTLPESNSDSVWQRRLIEKLDLLVASQSTSAAQKTTGTAQPIEAVWILAASLGGPDAVARFLGALPDGLPIALIYAQHIEAGFEQNLAAALERQHTAYTIDLGHGCKRLLAGHVILVPKEHQIRFLAHDQLVESRQAWEGRYQPAIDQVVADVARIYRQRAGVIVFTGTCDDGAIGARVMSACGGEVWVQSPDSCLASAMPDAVLAAVPVKQQGTPEQLAEALAARYAQSHRSF